MALRNLYTPAIETAPLFLAFLFTLGHAVFAQTSSSCNPSDPQPTVTVSVSRSPFTVVPSADGCWLFASAGNGVAVLKRGPDGVRQVRQVPVTSMAGIVLTHDGKLLIGAAGNQVVFLDVAVLTGAADDPNIRAQVGAISANGQSGGVYVNVTSDDRLLFVSQENSGTITVIDLKRARASGYTSDAIIGNISTGRAPIALTFSKDEKWLFTTSEVAAPTWHWKAACTAEGSNRADIVAPEGAVGVIDVAKAETDPGSAVVAQVPAGCSAVRSALSPDGDRLFVTARNSNAVLEFDTAKLVSDPQNARLGSAPTGTAPVPVAVVNGGRMVLAGNSNRFAGSGGSETLTVLDAARISQGPAAVIGGIAVGAFPREMRVSADGHTLFVTNAGSGSVQILDVDHLPIVPVMQLATPATSARSSALPRIPLATAAVTTPLSPSDAAIVDKSNASDAANYAAQAAPGGDATATRVAEANAASKADAAATEAELAAAAVLSDNSKAAAAATAGDAATANAAREQAKIDLAVLLAADTKLVEALSAASAAAAGNAAFYGEGTGQAAINNLAAGDAAAAADELRAIAGGDSGGFGAAVDHLTAAMKAAGTIESLAPARFQGVADRESTALTAAKAAAAGGDENASAAISELLKAAASMAAIDGQGNPFAAVVEQAAKAGADVASHTLAARRAANTPAK
jgi:DNA-binding beta-propeller fold protein YncE